MTNTSCSRIVQSREQGVEVGAATTQTVLALDARDTWVGGGAAEQKRGSVADQLRAILRLVAQIDASIPPLFFVTCRLGLLMPSLQRPLRG